MLVQKLKIAIKINSFIKGFIKDYKLVKKRDENTQQGSAAVVKGTRMQCGLCEGISWMANVTAFINSTNLAQTSSPYFLQKKQLQSSLITKTNCQYVFFFKIKD